jgi:hypothetical protein
MGAPVTVVIDYADEAAPRARGERPCG